MQARKFRRGCDTTFSSAAEGKSGMDGMGALVSCLGLNVDGLELC